MDDNKWDRYGLVGGVVFVVLNIAGGASTGKPPAVGDSTAEIAKYFTDHEGALKAAQAMNGIGAIALMWWFGTLWRRMSNAENGRHQLSIVSLIGLAIGGALALAANGVLAALALRPDELPDSTPTFWALSVVLLAASSFAVATHLLATNALAIRTKMLPTWVALLGLVSALLFVASAIVSSVSDEFIGSGLGLPAFLSWAVWILATTFTLWRSPEHLQP